MLKTITYSEASQGWTSFFSFYPEQMVGMNNYFYSFKGGNLFRHNSDNVPRCNFYGVQYESSVQTVFNDSPSTNKLHRTLAIIGDAGWSAEIETDIQSGAYIEEAWFEKKEGSWFAFIRSPEAVPANAAEYPLRSLTGIGRSATVTGAGVAVNINFAITPTPISIGPIVSVGDYLYYALPPYTTPVLCGVVTAIDVDYPNSINRLVVDTTITGGNVPPIGTAFFLSIKNQIAESLGILGHYAVVSLENDSTEKVELFSIESQVQQSFPR